MKQVIIVVPKGDIDISSITGCFHVLCWANRYWQNLGHRPAIEIRLAGYERELKLDFGFFSVHPMHIDGIEKADLLIIPSLNQDYAPVINTNKGLIDWIGNQHKNGAELASMCTGSFLLAATGLLDGRNCSTHWDAASDLQRMFPNVHVRTDILTTTANR